MISIAAPILGGLIHYDAGPIKTGAKRVFIGGKAAARAAIDVVSCHAPEVIAQGSRTVAIENFPAARIDDQTQCGGSIGEGFPTVFIGRDPATYVDIGSEVPLWLQIVYVAAGLSGLAKGAIEMVATLRVGVGVAPAALGDLTAAEVREIQAVADEAGRPMEVVGSAASGTRRGVGTDLPIGKGPDTRSDIDFLVPPSSSTYIRGSGKQALHRLIRTQGSFQVFIIRSSVQRSGSNRAWLHTSSPELVHETTHVLVQVQASPPGPMAWWRQEMGCGVTAFDTDDAAALIGARVFGGAPLPPIDRIEADIDVVNVGSRTREAQYGKPVCAWGVVSDGVLMLRSWGIYHHLPV